MAATNYTNITIRTLTNSKVVVPFSAIGTGTISTVGNGVVGTGTAFLSELVNGSWIVDLANNEFRQVIAVIDDTQALLAQAFTSDIAALSALEIVAGKKVKTLPCEIAIVVPTGSDPAVLVTTEESDLPAGLPVNISKASRDESGARDLIHPIIVDATGTIALISILY